MFGRKKQPERPAPDRKQSLAGIPVLDNSVSIERRRTDEGGMVLMCRHARGRGWLSRLAPPVLERRIELDELGAFVVGCIDGRRDVAGIASDFAKKFNVCRREAELCTAAFLKRLVQRRVAVIAMRS